MAVIAHCMTYALTVIAVIIGQCRGAIPEPSGSGYFGLGKALIPVCCVALPWCAGVIVAYLAPSANHCIIGYFGVALGIGALLTVYAWIALRNGTPSVPGAGGAPLDIPEAADA